MESFIAHIDSLLLPPKPFQLFFWLACLYGGLAMLAVSACTAYTRVRRARRNGKKLRARLAQEDELVLAQRLRRLTR